MGCRLRLMNHWIGTMDKAFLPCILGRLTTKTTPQNGIAMMMRFSAVPDAVGFSYPTTHCSER